MPSATPNASAKGDNHGKKWKILDTALREVQPHLKEVLEAAQRAEELSKVNRTLEEREAAHSRERENLEQQRLTELENLKQQHAHELAASRNECSKLRRAHEQALFSFSRSKDDMGEKMRTLEKRSKALQDAQRQEDEKKRQELTEDLASTTNTLLNKKLELEESQFLRAGMQTKLTDAKRELDSLHLAIGWEDREQSMSTVSEELEELAKQLHATMAQHFARPFPGDTDKGKLFQKTAASKLTRIANRHIPTLESAASQSFRAAVAEAVTAREMVETVFRGAEITACSEGIFAGALLKRLQDSRPIHEAILRSVLTNAFASEIESSTRNAIQKATDQTMATLEPLTSALGNTQVVTSDVEKIFRRAANVWQRVTKLRKKVAASLEEYYPDLFSVRDEHNAGELTQEELASAADQASSIVLFPRIVAHNLQQPVHPGIVLRAEQTVSVKAFIEAYRQKSRTASGMQSRLNRSNTDNNRR